MRKIIVMLVCISAVAFLCPSAGATTISFSDSAIYAPTWANGTADDTRDVIGTPQIVGGNVLIDDTTGFLESISFDYSSFADLYTAGDLFIDIGQDGYWDYVASTSTGELFNIKSEFSAAKGVNDDYYLTSDDFKVRSWSDYRDGHAVAMNLDAEGLAYESAGAFSFSNFNADTRTDVIFSELGIDIGGQPFAFLFAPTCGNDVVYTEVPEPGTLMFFSLFLFGFGLLKRFRFSE